MRDLFHAVYRIVLGLLIVLAAGATPDVDTLQASFIKRWPQGNMVKFRAWRELVASAAALSDAERLKQVNQFFNRTVVYSEDIVTWGQAVYWATPIETMGKGAGDCVGFVIAKFFTLKMMGIPENKLRLIYVYAHFGSGPDAPKQAHMVLAFYATPEADPLVLDNLLGDVRLASLRPDLTPVFSFNTQGVFVGTSSASVPSGAGHLSRWEDLLKRARAEGFD
ncbi:transglutaminase-like cysteine peptidase [Rhodoferax sp.]|uniref:transglutaminase-like cysteine peptidase n=1 Tax=Rhodoferax sp. TaxID=50421 RepID=UPI00285014C6|nr:transglutaminase-like cysteine peptidase [Rhodoferax sp.]MDR3368700.1 transglutaminase-like cysteine peptidase [Rhodoferax sp.]